MKATLQNHNQTPRKVRLVADFVKGKSVPAALAALEVLPKRGAGPVAKLIKSAAANAKARGEDPETMLVKGIFVESAGMLKKYMPRAFGRASLIRRYLTKRLRGTFVSNIEIERSASELRVIVSSGRPGLIIGRSGESATKLRKELTALVRRTAPSDRRT